MKYFAKLENAIMNEDFYETNQVLEKIQCESDAFAYLAVIFGIMEKNPELDYGMPGPVVHFMEKYYKKGYEEMLLNSIQKVPTSHTVWMLNRILNDPELNNREMYINVLHSCLDRSDISSVVRSDIIEFLNYQQEL